MSKKTRYHIGDFGPGICTAAEGNCPYRDENNNELPHYDTFEECSKAYEEKMEAEEGRFQTVNMKNTNLSKLIKNPELNKALKNPELTKLLEDRDRLQAELNKMEENKTPTFDEVNKIVAVSDELGVVKSRINMIKDQNAEIVKRVFDEPEERDFTLPDNFKKTATEESGSREWLIARQSSLGGSDVGALVFADPKYGSSNYYQVRNSKLDPDPQDQEHVGAAGRGDIWEPALIEIVGDKLGEQVFINKSTFREIDENGEDLYRHVNLDGFTLNEDGSIKSIIECKTSSFPEHWEDGKIPPGYVLQTQHYMDCLGVSKAYIVVNIDDVDLKVVEVTPDTKVMATEQAGKRKDLRLTGEFSYKDVKDHAVNKVKEFIDLKDSIAKKGAVKRPIRKAWKEGWSKAFKNPAGMAFIDIETSHTSDKRGHVLEVAAFKEDPITGEVKKYHRFYGVPKNHEEWNGTGRSDIHHIKPEDVAGLKPLRYDKEAQNELRDFLTDKTTGKMATGVAHNASYEKKFFTNAIGLDDIEWADTMTAYSSLGDEDRANNTLESLVNESGSSYEDAHHADKDAWMMYEAYKNYLKPKMINELGE